MDGGQRTILHVDMDAFFASVEQHDRPELKGRPVVIGAAPNQRGVVAAASYEAREYGIHSAMPSVEAGRRCPQAVFLPVNGARYREVSNQVFEIFGRFTPLVEPLSIDEAFLDVTGSRRLFGTGEEIAARIKSDVREETGLTCSVGVATNKFLAKLASDLEKPDGLTVVPRSRPEIVDFLAPLPISCIFGVGKVTRQHLQQSGWHTIGDLQKAPAAALTRAVGQHAAGHLARLARGEDEREVETEQREKGISREHTFGRDCRDPARVESVLCELVEDVARRLRRDGRQAGLVRLKLRWANFRTITRQRVLDHPCCDSFTLREQARALLRAQQPLPAVRLVGFGVGKLAEPADEQLSLFAAEGDKDPRHESLSRVMDDIQEKFGRGSIRRIAGGEGDEEGERG